MTYKQHKDINIEKSVLDAVFSSGLYELSGMPDSGTTSAALEILDRITDNNKTALYITNIENPVLYSTAKEIIVQHPDSIVFVSIEYANTNNLFNIISSYSGIIDFIVIDNFAYSILNKYRMAITYIADMLKRYVENNNVSIIIVNQLRYQVDPGSDRKSDELKPLYWDYLDTFITKRFIAVKEATKITVIPNPKFNERSGSFSMFDDIFSLLED